MFILSLILEPHLRTANDRTINGNKILLSHNQFLNMVLGLLLNSKRCFSILQSFSKTINLLSLQLFILCPCILQKEQRRVATRVKLFLFSPVKSIIFMLIRFT